MGRTVFFFKVCFTFDTLYKFFWLPVVVQVQSLFIDASWDLSLNSFAQGEGGEGDCAP